MYAFALVLLDAVVGRAHHLKSFRSAANRFASAQGWRPTVPEEVEDRNPTICNLIRTMWAQDPAARPTSAQVSVQLRDLDVVVPKQVVAVAQNAKRRRRSTMVLGAAAKAEAKRKSLVVSEEYSAKQLREELAEAVADAEGWRLRCEGELSLYLTRLVTPQHGWTGFDRALLDDAKQMCRSSEGWADVFDTSFALPKQLASADWSGSNKGDMTRCTSTVLPFDAASVFERFSTGMDASDAPHRADRNVAYFEKVSTLDPHHDLIDIRTPAKSVFQQRRVLAIRMFIADAESGRFYVLGRSVPGNGDYVRLVKALPAIRTTAVEAYLRMKCKCRFIVDR